MAPLPRSAPQDEMFDRILDGALAEIMDHGMQRSSLDSVAARIGVDRRDVASRFDKETLCNAVMAREARRYLEKVSLGLVGDTLPARVEEGFVGGVARRDEQTILQALLQRDPAGAMGYLVGPVAGQLLEYAIAITRKSLREAPDCDRYAPASIDAAATAMIRLAYSLSNAPPDTGMDDHYLRGIARTVLLPILTPVEPAQALR